MMSMCIHTGSLLSLLLHIAFCHVYPVLDLSFNHQAVFPETTSPVPKLKSRHKLHLLPGLDRLGRSLGAHPLNGVDIVLKVTEAQQPTTSDHSSSTDALIARTAQGTRGGEGAGGEGGGGGREGVSRLPKSCQRRKTNEKGAPVVIENLEKVTK